MKDASHDEQDARQLMNWVYQSSVIAGQHTEASEAHNNKRAYGKRCRKVSQIHGVIHQKIQNLSNIGTNPINQNEAALCLVYFTKCDY
jgi:hypothetical protein